MQVSQCDDHVTHAVIGQSESVSMGMSEDAALMHILSSSLYTYPKLAAVREVICNGWDGHIIAGKLDTPLEITLAEGQFRVRDFGPGIAHEQIGPIYGTYGNSTKRTDSTQTGGFGLGSKAPFAYVDNFEVISCHQGTKTIYRVSKSSMEKGGKPSINKIISMPTDETGITVTYAVKELDKSEFLDLINEVVLLGGIPASINGNDPVEPLPLAESPTKYIINSVKGTLINRINLRYGNVVYPVPLNNGFEAEWRHVLSNMNKLWNHANIIFLAEPDSVSIAPNRESLNFTEGTIKTIKGLLSQFSTQDMANCESVVKQAVSSIVNRTLKEREPDTTRQALFNDYPLDLSQHRGALHQSGPYAFTMRKARINHLISSTSTSVSHANIFMKRLERAIAGKAFPDNKFAKAMRKAMIKWDDTPYRERARRQSYMQAVYYKFIAKPLYDRLGSSDLLDIDRVFIGQNTYTWGKPDIVRLKNLPVETRDTAIDVLQKRALVVRSKTAAKLWLEGQEKSGGNGWLIYVSTNKPEHAQAAEAMFKALGYDTHVHIPAPVPRIKASDDPNYVAPARKTAPKRKGYLTLAQSFDGSTYLLTTAREKGADTGLTDPIAWAVLENKSHYREGKIFHEMGEDACRATYQLWGDRIAVVTFSQSQVLLSKGIPSVKTYIENYVDNTLSARPDFPRYLAFGYQIALDDHYWNREPNAIMQNMLEHESLMKELGIRFSISAETATLLTFFHDNRYGAFEKCRALKAKVKPSPLVSVIREKIQRSPWKEFLNLDHLTDALGKAAPDSPETEIPYTILRNLLK